MNANDEDADMEQRRKWRIERSVNVGHILTTIIMASSILAWANRMDSRVTVLETTYGYLAASDQKQERDTSEKVALLREDLREINRKLDRLIDGKRKE